MFRLLTLALLISVGGCATAPTSTEPKQAWDISSAAPLSPEQAVAEAHTPATCELAAEQHLATDAGAGWKMLKLCTRRWLYTDLRHLLDGPWVEQLKKQPDGMLYLAQLIALRGGDVDSDVPLLRAKGLNVYSLAGVAERPSDRRDAYVLVRARVSDAFVTSDHVRTFVLAEITRGLAHAPAAPTISASPNIAAPPLTPTATGEAPDPAAALQQLAALQQTLSASSAPAAPTPAPASGLNLEFEDSGLMAVATLAPGAKAPPDDANLLFLARVEGAVRMPGVDDLAAKGYEKEPLVPLLTLLRHYPMSGLAMY